MTGTSKTTKAKTTKLKPRVIKALLEHKADQERFDGLVQISGLSQAEYIRRCCLEPTLMVVPDSNISVYTTLSQLQQSVQNVLKGELPESSREQLAVALEHLKTTRLRLVDVDPTAVGETEADSAGETGADAEGYEL